LVKVDGELGRGVELTTLDKVPEADCVDRTQVLAIGLDVGIESVEGVMDALKEGRSAPSFALTGLPVGKVHHEASIALEGATGLTGFAFHYLGAKCLDVRSILLAPEWLDAGLVILEAADALGGLSIPSPNLDGAGNDSGRERIKAPIEDQVLPDRIGWLDLKGSSRDLATATIPLD
jgi:hypothetical protein